MRKRTLALALILLITVSTTVILVSVARQSRLTVLPSPTPTTQPLATVTVAGAPPQSTATTARTTVTLPPAATAVLAATTPSPVAESGPAAFLAMLESLPVPQRNLADLARRFKQAPPTSGAAAAQTPHTTGSKDVFWATDMANMEHFTVTATLLYASEHLYMYVDDGLSDITKDQLKSSADVFETSIYPTTRRYFGTAWAAGLDGDEHISVLHMTRLGAAGAFSAADEESVIGNPYSNGRHMIYMNAANIHPGSASYNSVLAHEFQHAIHFFEDPNEDAWVNEGASVLSEKLNGLASAERSVSSFMQHPDTQLTTWGDDPDLGAHYGAAYAFMDYFHQRYGDQALLWLIAEQANGAAGFDRVLARLGRSETFDSVFADWVVANVMNGSSADGSSDSYNSDVSMPANNSLTTTPIYRSITFPQYAGYYVELPALLGPATVYFTGTTQTQLAAAAPHSGAYDWWGNRGDMMDATLTRAFDLSGLTSATLTYWMWYDLEQDWDYAYVAVSTDSGETWTTLATAHTTDSNPVGNNLGSSYTGKSGNSATSAWIAERVDLASFAGKKVLVRFEYVTDDAVTNPGFCVDDIAVPELGFSDDAEGEAGWNAQGFVRSSNTIPQAFALRLITFTNPPDVRQIAVDTAGHAQITVAGSQRMILAIAGVAPITTEKAVFQYSIHQQ